MAGQDGIKELKDKLREAGRRQEEVEDRLIELSRALKKKQAQNALEDLELILGLLEAWAENHAEQVDGNVRGAFQDLSSLKITLLS